MHKEYSLVSKNLSEFVIISSVANNKLEKTLSFDAIFVKLDFSSIWVGLKERITENVHQSEIVCFEVRAGESWSSEKSSKRKRHNVPKGFLIIERQTNVI